MRGVQWVRRRKGALLAWGGLGLVVVLIVVLALLPLP